tara:strand:- start:5001 stop:5561 length:561 start_codon:yes stop_codon:yes gene_type:complete
MLLKLKIKYTLIILFSSFLFLFSQVETDSFIHQDIFLDEVVLESSKLNLEDQRAYLWLRRKVLRVYPYIDSLRYILNEADSSINNLKKKRHTRRYVRKFQKKIMNRFSNNITNLTRQEGVILSKLIYREFDITAYDLINKYRGGVHAFFWQRISRLYDGNLKSAYNPDQNMQDFYIEHILQNSVQE